MREDKEKTRLEYLDDLTGLHNRRYFRERLLEEKRKADAKGLSFALMMIDLDNFKPINDRHGHLTGDQVLTEVGRLLEMSVRPSDTLCRYAGDEFVVTLPEIEEDDVIEVAERIKNNFAGASWVDEKGEPIQPVTCSLGYALYSEKGRGLNELVGGADQALYVAKRRGGNGYAGETDLHKEPIGRPLNTTPHIVGREEKLVRLRSLLEPIHEEKGRLMLIHGEAGVGKTRLVKELQQVLERRGGIALLGDCHEETRSIPYYPFREAFNRFFDERKDAGFSVLENLPEYSQRELARILPRLKHMKPSELERAPDSFRLFEAVRFLVQNLSTQSKYPLLFIVEDLHWSDDASLDLLHYLVRNLSETGVLLCGTYRTEEKEASPSLLRFAGLLRRERLSEEMRLEPLSTEGVSTMLRFLYPGTKIPQDFQDFMYQKTEGNPFFVEELVKYLSEEEIGEGLPKIREVPLSICAVLQRRIDSLGPGMEEILACAALVGEEFEFEVLQGVQDRPQREILGAMEAAVKAHVVRENFEGGEERYHFVHSLMADVLYSGIGRVRRRLWHAQVGNALEELYAGRLEQLNGRLAYHFERGENWEKALSYAIRSATQAKEDYANQEAVRLYEKARDILPRLARESEEDRIAIAEGLGDVYQITGDYEKVLQEYNSVEILARGRGDRKKEAEALSRIARVYHRQGNYDEMMGYAERSLEIRQKIGDRNGLADSLHSLGIVHAQRGDYDDGLKYFQEALNMRGELGDRRGVASSLHSIEILHWSRGDYVDALKCLQESLNIRRGVGDIQHVAASLQKNESVHLTQEHCEEGMKCLQESLAIRREMGDKRGVAFSLVSMGIVHLNRGNYSEALKRLEEALKIAREIGHKAGTAFGLRSIGIIHLNRGNYVEALKCYRESLEIWEKIGNRWGVADGLDTIGILHTEQGNYVEGMRCYRESLEIWEKIGNKKGMASGLMEMGTFYQQLYDIEKATEYHEQSLGLMEEMGMKAEKTAVFARIGSDCHLAGDDKMALRYLNDALEIVEELGIREPEPGVLGALSEVWLSRGDSTKADEFCERLLRMAEKEGLKKYLAVAKKLKGEIILNEAVSLNEAERELKEAGKIAKKIGALPVLWQIHASLGKTYEKKGDKKKAFAEFKKARKIVDDLASKIGDEDLKNTFLNSIQIQSINQ